MRINVKSRIGQLITCVMIAQDLLVEQCQQVKQMHPRTTVIVYIDGLRVQPFYSVLRKIMRDPAYQG